jgi:CubicO group peptidase (beta-lactamase class C family)
MKHNFFLITLSVLSLTVYSAPDEEKLGKSNGFPIGTGATYFYDESVRVGSFTNMDKVFPRNLAHLEKSAQPMPLPKAATEPSGFKWHATNAMNLTVDDYLSRQRVMGLLVIKDGSIVVERYQYDRTANQRFMSNSMAKSLLSLAFGLAVEEGLIKSLDVRADSLAPELNGSLYGEATLRQLLRMSSGVKFSEVYDGKDDLSRFVTRSHSHGIASASQDLREREAPAGDRFKYASAESAVLSLAFQSATRKNLAEYLSAKLWQPLGAEHTAFWLKNQQGVVSGSGGFNATLRDYGRLGVVLANDGLRPDNQTQVIPKSYLLEATDWTKQPNAFHPRKATTYFGYGYKFWLFPGTKRRFAMIGTYGQYIFVDPELKLIMVQTTANQTASSGKTTLGKEADDFWRGWVNFYGSWN